MPRSQLERAWLIGGVLIGLIMVVLAYLVFIGPQRSSTSQVNQKVGNAQVQNEILRAKVEALTAQNKNLASYQHAWQQAELALPSTSGLPDFLRSLQAIGTATSTDVTTLTVGAPTDLTPVTSSPAATGSGASSGSTGAAGTSSAKGIGKPAGSAASKVYALPITAQVTGTDTQLADFLTQLQSVQPRAVLISQVTEGAVATGGTTQKGKNASTLQLTMQAFVAPSSQVEADQLAQAAGK